MSLSQVVRTHDTLRQILRLVRLPAVASVTVAVIAYCAMATTSVAHKSGTFDEFVHVTSGYSYWTFNDYRLNPENANWAQRLVALPLVLGDNQFPSLDQTAWRLSDMWELADQFFFGEGKDADSLLRQARFTVTLAGALLGILVFIWSRHLFGLAGGWVSLVVYVFSPTMLAHGALATSDLIGSAFFTAAAWALWTVMHRVTPWTVAASTLATSGLFLSKLSAPILIPIGIGMLVVRMICARPLLIRWGRRRIEIHRRLSQGSVVLALVATHVAVAIILIWSSYGLRYNAMVAHTTGREEFIDPWSEVLTDSSATTRLARWGRQHHVLPEAYLYGFSSVVAYSKNRSAFLNGEVTTAGGWRWFFPYAALVKTTMAELLLLAAALLMLVWARKGDSIEATSLEQRRGRAYDLTPLVMLIGVYWAFAISSGLNIGHRHLLPAVPATIVLIGASGEGISRLLRRRTGSEGWRLRSWLALLMRTGWRTSAAAALVAVLLTWHALESIRIAPNYIAYFNALAGGPKEAYRHLVDSSLDWGQDLPGLKEWLDRAGLQRPNHQPVYLSYFGTAMPSYYNIDAKLLPGFSDRWTPRLPEPLTGGTYCISATMLQGVYLKAPGPWTDQYEADYQAVIDNLKVFESTSTSARARAALLRQTGEGFWLKMFHGFEQLRFARLAAHLRQRQPEAQVGYSILIFRLTNEEVESAVNGPPP